MNGMIHLYIGTGKGKTTAAVGQSIRFAGQGGQVLFTQFLKSDSSGEVSILKRIPEIDVMHCGIEPKFTFQMTDQEKKLAHEMWEQYFDQIRQKVKENNYGLLVMDEVVDACNSGMIKETELLDFLRDRPENLEVVMTGRNPSENLQKTADYITDMKMVLHPYQKGIAARRGIEY